MCRFVLFNTGYLGYTSLICYMAIAIFNGFVYTMFCMRFYLFVEYVIIIIICYITIIILLSTNCVYKMWLISYEFSGVFDIVSGVEDALFYCMRTI